MQRNVRLFVLAAWLALAGCTEEKAQALKTATEVFRDKAADAIDTAQELYIVAAIGESSEAQRIQAAVGQLRAAAREQKTLTSDHFNGAVRTIFAREEAEAHTRSMEELKQAYVEFAAAFSRLPEGSALGAEAVTCAAALGTRLVYRLAQHHEVLASNPVALFKDESAARAEVMRAARAGGDTEVEKTALVWVELLKKARRENAAALAKLADATLAGAEALELIRNYGTLSVSDLLNGASRILELRTSYLGLGSDMAAQRLTQIREQMDGDARLKPVLDAPAAIYVPQCKR